jgi:hypothetical protein
VTDPAQTASFDVDTALSNIESTGSAEGVAPEPTGTPETVTPELIEYVTDGGKTVKETLDMIKKRASMGYHYAQRMEALKKQEASIAEQVKRAQELQRWDDYDKYSRENPEWAEHWNKAWEGRHGFSPQQAQASIQAQLDPNNPLAAELQALKAQLGPLSEFARTVQEERQAAQRASEDKALDSEVKAIREKYPKIDFDLADENGKSLEFRVMEYAAKNGIRSFKTAFHDFYHDNLVKAQEDGAREQSVKQQVQQRKLGIVGITDTPTKGLGRAQNLKSKSYDDLTREALAELGTA